MSLTDEPAPLSPWPFLIADVLVVGTASALGYQAHPPYSSAVVIGIGTLVAAGAALTVLPFVINHARKQDLLLAERQREIAALAQTVRDCTEQLSIAASSLHSIAENAAKSVKQAEQLPGKLQEKIHEFKERLNEVSSTENEALSQEVNALRSAETERIETVVTTVRKLSGEFARLEAASRKNVSELSDSLTRFTTSAEQAAVEATTAVAALRAGSEKSLASAHAAAISAIENSVQHALAELDEKLALFADRLTAKIDRAAATLDDKLAGLAALGATRKNLPSEPAATETPSHSPNARAESSASSSKTLVAPSIPVSENTQTASPESVRDTPNAVVATATDPEAKPVRKKIVTPKPVPAEDEFSLGLDLPEQTSSDDFNQVGPEANASDAVSQDGLTRLVVTAYIGIGNKLFARGEGPGLSWEQGTPLQFVSIGKWRWETSETDAPVRIKLYKNDVQECTVLGEVSIDSGQQREVTATF